MKICTLMKTVHVSGFHLSGNYFKKDIQKNLKPLIRVF